MSTVPTSAPDTTSANGREANGRFGKGNQFGSGNPFARQVASLRIALVESVTTEEMHAIAARLVEDARAGDKTATKLLFQYVLGKPQPAVDPDTLDVQEFRGLQQSAVPPEVIAEMARGVPLQLVLQLLPILMAAKAGDLGAFVQAECEQMDERDRRREERKAARAERKRRRRAARQRTQEQEAVAAVAPSTNGDDGSAREPEGDNRPSTNGDNGDGMMDMFLNWLRGRRKPSDTDPQS
jgi:hypothetical protein